MKVIGYLFQVTYLDPNNGEKTARKIIVPPIESELSFSTGTFLNNYDVINRKLQPLLIYSTVGKRAKRMPDPIVETTQYNCAV